MKLTPGREFLRRFSHYTDEPGRPDVEPGQPDVEPGRPDVEPGRPDVEPGRPDVEPGRPDVEPGQTLHRRAGTTGRPGPHYTDEPGRPEQHYSRGRTAKLLYRKCKTFFLRYTFAQNSISRAGT